jgi:hypothetical protein
MIGNRPRTGIRALPLRVAVALMLVAAFAAAASARTPVRQRPSVFGPSPAVPYSFAQPVPIYPTPGESVLGKRQGGATSYEEQRLDAAKAAAASRDPNPAPPSARIDTRLGPLH